ncbi:hypothetical protein GWI33_012242, partial [Rhynchophorus ferrugineus]
SPVCDSRLGTPKGVSGRGRCVRADFLVGTEGGVSSRPRLGEAEVSQVGRSVRAGLAGTEVSKVDRCVTAGQAVPRCRPVCNSRIGGPKCLGECQRNRC